MDKLLFRAEVKKQLTLRNWSYDDLAAHTTYKSGNSIAQLLYENPNDPRKLTDRFVSEVSKALDIDVNALG